MPETFIESLFSHARWADARLLVALRAANGPPAGLKEFNHYLGAAEAWLSRIEGRAMRGIVWPVLSIDGSEALMAEVHASYAAYLGALGARDLEQMITYSNSSGASFTTSVQDILTQVAMHAQYHRGKVNQILRDGGHEPVALDFIGWTRERA